jgi:hypothetical protein
MPDILPQSFGRFTQRQRAKRTKRKGDMERVEYFAQSQQRKGGWFGASVKNLCVLSG